MKFDDWFEAQFGKEPSPSFTLFQLQQQVWNCRGKLDDAEEALRTKQEWVRKQAACLYCWQIKDEDK